MSHQSITTKSHVLVASNSEHALSSKKQSRFKPVKKVSGETMTKTVKKVQKNTPLTRRWAPDVFTFSAAAGWPMNSSTNQTFFLEPDIQKTYTGATQQRTVAQGALFVGWQKKLPRHVTGQFGVSMGASTNASLTGTIWEDANPDFNNFRYGYTITHSQTSIEGKLLGDWSGIVRPYINGSLGIAFNRAGPFSIAPFISEEVPAPAFQKNTTTSFTYAVGLGLQRPIAQHWEAGVGYAFSDWGKIHLSPAPTQAFNTAPSLSHLYVNSLVFNVSYVK